MRASGILMPVFSIPSPYGIGCFSKEAYEFVDRLAEAGQKYWQILPLGPTGYGDSPYQSFSTFAGNPYFIDLDSLTEEGLLTKEECESYDFGTHQTEIDYGRLYRSRREILYKAYERSGADLDEQFRQFCGENADWLDDYALYTEVKYNFGEKAWNEWDEDIRVRTPEALKNYREKYEKGMRYQQFVQYIFHNQWKRLKEYANHRGIQIIGDIPIYVAFDSADSWANPELFQFDENHTPLAVSGVPPDGFSAGGQLWGNPLYDWTYHRKTGFEWWIKRIAYMSRIYDVIRIDHFRGFDEYYSVPWGAKDARGGEWKKGPGYEIFETINKVLGNIPIIAEDLGFLTDTVVELVKKSDYPGMKVLQFAFDSREAGDYLPYNYERNCVVYTGTHDNNTTKAWYDSLCGDGRNLALRYLGREELTEEEISWEFIRLAQASVADTCIIPIQDYLNLGEEARMNEPSTVGKNWKWRLLQGQLTEELISRIRQMTALYGRL